MKGFKKEFVLGADIGATNTRTGMMLMHGTSISNIAHTKSNSLEDLTDFLICQLSPHIKSVCLAVPGAVSNQKAFLTNLGYNISAEEMKRRLGVPVVLVNDLAAQVTGISLISGSEHSKLLHRSERHSTYSVHYAVIAPGSGLGVGYCSKGGFRHASEGGHYDFAVTNPELYDFLGWLWKRYGSKSDRYPHISYERVISAGMGIPNIMAWILGADPKTTDLPSGEEVFNRSQNGEMAAKKALLVFAEILGAFSGCLAKTLIPRDLFLTANSAALLLEGINADEMRDCFLKSYFHRGRDPLVNLAESTNIKIVTNQYLGVAGAAIEAKEFALSL